VRWEKPVLTIDTLGTPAIPHLRITHQGYVNLKDRKILSLEV
jgi:adenine deaminase